MKVIFFDLVKSFWDKTGIITKIFIVWSFGPPLMVYLLMGYKEEYKNEIKAEIRLERDEWARPLIVERNGEIKAINENITNLRLDLATSKNDVKADIRELRMLILSRYK